MYNYLNKRYVSGSNEGIYVVTEHTVKGLAVNFGAMCVRIEAWRY